ncbi:MAG: DUF3990 domain-containing protein [Victivallales bacterium]|nr:DUF3990 domain-containing protein [Victivallales bacterium]
MRLHEGMTLYHGSYMPVEKIDLAKCSIGKDFGKGFYLTSDIDQAKRFIATSVKKAINAGRLNAEQNYGYCSAFEFHGNPAELHYFDFQQAGEKWLRFVAYNRTGMNDVGFLQGFPDDIYHAEIISGKVANDRTNPIITAYLGGLYGPMEERSAIDTAIRLLRPRALKDQFCFLTENAVNCLIFKGVTRHG